MSDVSSNNDSSDNNDEEESDDGFWNSEDAQAEEDEDAQADRDLFTAVNWNDAAALERALQNGANVNGVNHFGMRNSLMLACHYGFEGIVRTLLDAGADPWWSNRNGWSAVFDAIRGGHLSIVEMLINHDKELLEIEDRDGWTPLMVAISHRQFEVVRFLLDRGANASATNKVGLTTLLLACRNGYGLDIVRWLLADGIDVEARDENQRSALHHAASSCEIEVVRKLIVTHNANMFAVDRFEETAFDQVTLFSTSGTINFLIERYINKLTQEHGRLALHAILGAAKYSFAINGEFHPPQNPLRIRLPLGKLTLHHFRTLLLTLDAELIRNRDDNRKLPIHIACRNMAPVEIIAMLTEMDPTTLHAADYSGALPIHLLHYGSNPAEYASVRYLAEQGGVGILAARNQIGGLPLHALCGSKNPSLRTIQFLIQSFPESLASRTNSGQYPFMSAACKSSTASLSVVYELVRANPDLVVPH